MLSGTLDTFTSFAAPPKIPGYDYHTKHISMEEYILSGKPGIKHRSDKQWEVPLLHLFYNIYS